jgi:putative nucleotidyltransferase with HDIG domain/PAS domain S-box-containing protein
MPEMFNFIKSIRGLYKGDIAVSKSDNSMQVPIKKDDEIEELANMVNIVPERFKERIKKLVDLVEQRTANIEQAKKQWEYTFDSITDPLFIHDERFRIIRANRAYAKAVGMSYNDFIGKPYYEIFPKRGGPFKMCLKALESQEEEEEVFQMDIDKIYKMRSYPVWDEPKKYLFSIHILEDITEARQAEEKIRREADINRTLLSVAESLSTTFDRKEIFKRVMKILPSLLEADRFVLFLLDNELKAFIPVCSQGMPEDLMALFMRIKVTKEIPIVEKIETGEVVIIEDVRESPLFPKDLAEAFRMRSIMYVPIISRGKTIGIIGIERIKVKSPFGDKEKAIFKGIAYQIATALENARLMLDLQELFIGTIKCLSGAIDAKSTWTMGHSERVTEYSIKIGKEMGLQGKDLEDLRIAGLLHDIGKIGTYDSILDKPGKLNDEEYEVVKKHPLKGAKMLSSMKELRHIIPWIRGHHERFDGKGYPDGLKGEEIPLQSRILSVADTFDSMTSNRPYRETPGREKMIEEIKRCSGTQFDPKVVESFLKVLEDEEEINNGS